MSATPLATDTFGQRLKQRRIQRGMSQRQVADRLNVTKAAYQQYEWDKVLPESGRIPALADALDLSASTIGRWLEDSPLLIASASDSGSGCFRRACAALGNHIGGVLTGPFDLEWVTA